MTRNLTSLVLIAVAIMSLSVACANVPQYVMTIEPVSNTSPVVEVTTDLSKTIASNNLSLGTQIHGWDNFPQNELLIQKTRLLGLKLVRIFVSSDKAADPCIYWNETAGSGTFDWKKLDALLDSIGQLGAKPLLNVGSGDNSSLGFAPGMFGDFNGTGFPNPKSFGAYVVAIIEHLKATNRRVTFWEIWRTPNIRDADGEISQDRISRYIDFFNNVQSFIHTADPAALLASDRTFYRTFFDAFSLRAIGVGFLNYMKYDAFGTPFYRPEGYLNETQIMQSAAELDKPQRGAWAKYSPQQMQQKWLQLHGDLLPVIVSEANVNSSYEAGTDPRIQTAFGAVWYAEIIRNFVLDGAVRYCVYYRLTSDESVEWASNRTKGYGLGMIRNSPPYEEWPAYWVNYLFGLYLDEGDELFNTTSSNSILLSSVGWHGSMEDVLVLIARQNVILDVNIHIDNTSVVGVPTFQIYTISDSSSKLTCMNVTYAPLVKLRLTGFTVCFLVFPRSA